MSMAIFGMGENVADFGSIIEVVDIAFNVDVIEEMVFGAEIIPIEFTLEVIECPPI